MNKATNFRYGFSITKGALFLEETMLLLKSVTLGDIKEDVDIDFGFLPQNSETGRSTIGKEIVKRIQSTDWDEIWLNFFDFEDTDKKLILLYVSASYHDILQDCLIEVYHKRWLSMSKTLSREDISYWIDEKAGVRPELLEIKEYTRKKVAQVLFRFLYESKLVVNETITPVEISPDLIDMFLKRGEKWFLEVSHQKI